MSILYHIAITKQNRSALTAEAGAMYPSQTPTLSNSCQRPFLIAVSNFEFRVHKRGRIPDRPMGYRSGDSAVFSTRDR